MPEISLRLGLASGTLVPENGEPTLSILAVLGQDRSIRSEGSDSGIWAASQGHPLKKDVSGQEQESRRDLA